MYGGKTVEVLKHHAEAVWCWPTRSRGRAREPDYLIETSTLTGAQKVALGDRTRDHGFDSSATVCRDRAGHG